MIHFCLGFSFTSKPAMGRPPWLWKPPKDSSTMDPHGWETVLGLQASPNSGDLLVPVLQPPWPSPAPCAWPVMSSYARDSGWMLNGKPSQNLHSMNGTNHQLIHFITSWLNYDELWSFTDLTIPETCAHLTLGMIHPNPSIISVTSRCEVTITDCKSRWDM